MLAEAWRERLELHAFVRRVMETCRRRQADTLLIEAKGPGISVGQEVRRLMRDGEWVIHLIDPGRADKAARLHAVVPLFADGVVYAPDRRWARMVIDEVGQVPKGSHDDLADTTSQALNWLRKSGIAKLGVEADDDERESRLFRGNSKPSVRQRYGM